MSVTKATRILSDIAITLEISFDELANREISEKTMLDVASHRNWSDINDEKVYILSVYKEHRLSEKAYDIIATAYSNLKKTCRVQKQPCFDDERTLRDIREG